MIIVELTETVAPMKIIGKKVYDTSAKLMGIIKSIKLRYPPLRVYIVVQNEYSYVEIPFEKIQSIGDIVQVNETFNSIRDTSQDYLEMRNLLEEDELLTLLLSRMSRYIDINLKTARGSDTLG